LKKQISLLFDHLYLITITVAVQRLPLPVV